jgi:tetratricopeptide (TPR) repeat protein
VFAFLTIQRNKDWKDNLSLFRADVAKSPNSVRLNDGYAEQLYRQLQQPNLKLTALEIQAILDTSEVHSQKSLEIKPGVSAYNNLGNLANYRRQYAQAVDYYKKALEVVPNYSYAKINLANSLQAWAMEEGEKKNNPDRARELLHESLEYQPDNANAYHLIGISYGVQGKHLEAIEMFEKAYALDPGNANIKRDLVTAYTASGQIEKARAIDVK